MTQNQRSKRATRSRMALTGEKYTDARRALLGPGGEGGGLGGDLGTTFASPGDPLGWFSDQAYNLVLLADDEARMLSHPTVEPEHLLLATTRRGNVERLLGGAPKARSTTRSCGREGWRETRASTPPLAGQRGGAWPRDRGSERPRHA